MNDAVFWILATVFSGSFFILAKSHTQKIRDVIKLELAESESKIEQKVFNSNDVKFLSVAYCSGSLFPHIVGVTAWIGIVGGSLYIRPVRQKLQIPIRLDTIFDFKVFSPQIPYIMNINPAAIIANEATRREVGNSIAIRVISPDGNITSIELGQFKIKRAEDLALFLHGAKLDAVGSRVAMGI
jgi:hypothetical protein